MSNWRHWHKPDFWRWWWTTGAREETKAVVFTGGVLMLAIVGYVSATGMADDEKAAFTEQAVTVTRTTLVKGKPRVVREVITTTLSAETQMRTIQRNGRTITVAAPGETVTRTKTTTIAGPVVESVVTKNGIVTVPRTVQGPERVVTAPGETQTQTVTGPTRTVTAPAQTVTNMQTVIGPPTTVTGPTTTVTGTTVTGPTQTVTRTVTDTETVTVTVTEPEP